MTSKLDVLILTQPSRLLFLGQIMLGLGKQLWNHSNVNVIMRVYDKELTLGENRNILRNKSSAEYIMFLDDDDWLAPDFFNRVMPHLHDNVDYIGFRVQCYCTHLNWTKYGETFHSLEYGGRAAPWAREGNRFFRDLVHTNPIKRELAMQAAFDGGFGEDARWAAKLRKLGIVKTQFYIDDVMYHYLWRAVKNDLVDAVNPTRQLLIEAIEDGGWRMWPARPVPGESVCNLPAFGRHGRPVFPHA